MFKIDQRSSVICWLTLCSLHNWHLNWDSVQPSHLLVLQHMLFTGLPNLKPVRTLMKYTLSEKKIKKVTISETFFWTIVVMHWFKLMLELRRNIYPRLEALWRNIKPQLTIFLLILVWKVKNLKNNSKSKQSLSKMLKRLNTPLKENSKSKIISRASALSSQQMVTEKHCH